MIDAGNTELVYVGNKNNDITSGKLYFKDAVLSELKTISSIHGKKIVFLSGFSGVCKIGAYFYKPINKAFGSLCYEKCLSIYKITYCKYNLYESIKETEKNEENIVSSKS